MQFITSKITGAVAAILLSAGVAAQGIDLSGNWQTQSGAVGGRGGGNNLMKATHRNGAVTLSYGDNTMLCTLNGQRCGGTWQGRTGSGWFSVTFSSDGRSFAGTWGYGNDRGNVGTFMGSR